MDEQVGLWGLFIGSFLAATLLPGGSEALLVGLLYYRPELLCSALLVATLGNTLGSVVTFAMGWLIPQHKTLKYRDKLQHYGPAALLLTWVPVIGDALCLTAGWLKLNPWWSLLWIAIGKFVRYALIGWAMI